jgi:hypothetical protein
VDGGSFSSNPAYRTTLVYGNILIEDNSGNNDVVHYGGDGTNTDSYRKGTLYFYNNTVISTRTATTRIIRLSSNDESCDFRNNIVYVAGTARLLDAYGTMRYRNNWLKSGWNSGGGSLIDEGGNLTGTAPGFADAAQQNFALTSGSVCINAATTLSSSVAGFPVSYEYVSHQQSRPRTIGGTIDIGAYEYGGSTALNPALAGIMPNRFNMVVKGNSLLFKLSARQEASVTMHTLNGNLVAVLKPGLTEPGINCVDLGLARLARGFYVVRLAAGTEVATQKVFLRD